MGAIGAWALAATQPQTFAAIVSVCGGFIGTEVPVGTNRAEMLRLAKQQHAETCYAALDKCKKYQLGSSIAKTTRLYHLSVLNIF